MSREVVLITGASSGIGRALALEFAKHGANLLLVARRGDALQQVRQQALALCPSLFVEIYCADLTNAGAPEALHEFCAAQGLIPTCLINNAGIGAEGEFTVLDAERQQHIIDLNVTALVKMCRLFLPDMKERRSGCIANISSTTAFMPLAGEAVYAASKAFVLSFSQALYEENRAYGVTVCTLCPGVTNTDFFANAGFSLNQFSAADPADFAAFAYRSIQRKRPLAIHRPSNRMIALWARLFPRGAVRRISAKACGK